MSRLSIEISSEQHQKIKAIAALKGKSIKDLILESVFSNMADEGSAMEELMSFLDRRIDSAEKGHVSTKTPNDIAQEVLGRHIIQ